MAEAEFSQLAQAGYNRIPVLAEASADLYTPLAVYMLLAGGPFSYLLESVVGGERFGRYSFIGLACAERIEARGRTIRRLLRDARGSDVAIANAHTNAASTPMSERLRATWGGSLPRVRMVDFSVVFIRM